MASVVRGADGAAEWVAPASFDDVPVRALDVRPEAVAPKSIVVPLPTGLETGGAFLAAMGAARWWGSARRRRT